MKTSLRQMNSSEKDQPKVYSFSPRYKSFLSIYSMIFAEYIKLVNVICPSSVKLTFLALA